MGVHGMLMCWSDGLAARVGAGRRSGGHGRVGLAGAQALCPLPNTSHTSPPSDIPPFPLLNPPACIHFPLLIPFPAGLPKRAAAAATPHVPPTPGPCPLHTPPPPPRGEALEHSWAGAGAGVGADVADGLGRGWVLVPGRAEALPYPSTLHIPHISCSSLQPQVQPTCNPFPLPPNPA